MKRIAVDAMGGDYAPNEIVKGAVEAFDTLPDTHITLVGHTEHIAQILNKQRRAVGRISIHHAGTSSDWMSRRKRRFGKSHRLPSAKPSTQNSEF